MLNKNTGTNHGTVTGVLIGLTYLISAFSFSDFNSSSMLSKIIFGFKNFFGCCSNPAYENVFLKATPLTRKESLILPPGT
jgi:hypothetical protein